MPDEITIVKIIGKKWEPIGKNVWGGEGVGTIAHFSNLIFKGDSLLVLLLFLSLWQIYMHVLYVRIYEYMLYVIQHILPINIHLR